MCRVRRFRHSGSYQRAWALISLGRFEEAGRLVNAALKDNPVDQGGVLHAARAMLRAKRGDRRGAEADVAEAIRVGKNFVHFHHTAYTIGAIYATLGEFDKAQEWIENAANDGFPNYAFFETDVHLERLRATPAFSRISLKAAAGMGAHSWRAGLTETFTPLRCRRSRFRQSIGIGRCPRPHILAGSPPDAHSSSGQSHTSTPPPS